MAGGVCVLGMVVDGEKWIKMVEFDERLLAT